MHAKIACGAWNLFGWACVLRCLLSSYAFHGLSPTTCHHLLWSLPRYCWLSKSIFVNDKGRLQICLMCSVEQPTVRWLLVCSPCITSFDMQLIFIQWKWPNRRCRRWSRSKQIHFIMAALEISSHHVTTTLRGAVMISSGSPVWHKSSKIHRTR